MTALDHIRRTLRLLDEELHQPRPSLEKAQYLVNHLFHWVSRCDDLPLLPPTPTDKDPIA